MGFLLSTIKPQVIRFRLVLYCKGKISLITNTDLLDQGEHYFLAVYMSLFHPRNEHYVFHHLLHFQAKFWFGSHQNKLAQLQWRPWSNSRFTRMPWRADSGPPVLELRQMRLQTVCLPLKGKLESNTYWFLNALPPPETANRGKVYEN